MVGSHGTMIAIRLVRSKLRKREEHSNSVHPTDVVLQTAPTQQHPAVTPVNQTTVVQTPQPLWQFPPVPQQPSLYSNDQVRESVLFYVIILHVPFSKIHGRFYVAGGAVFFCCPTPRF